MAERHHPRARLNGFDGGSGAVDEFGDTRDRHSDVVLPTWPFRLLPRRLVLAQGPKRMGLGLRLGEGGVLDQVVLQRLGQDPLKRRLSRARFAAGRLDQHEPGMIAWQRRALAGNVLADQVQALRANQLEGLQPATGLCLGAGQ